ncbi:Sulfate adenylyltransferase subunit 2 [Sphingomonas paucimobilis]|nr:Sulfate adenylyltransferase subunit 2 [Sphingomonas paucimobilis]
MTGLTHLQRLEAESIHILREVVAETEKPVMLYSVGKDSAVMLHLAKKAFFPARPPFPLLHVDTTWKFRAMYELRKRAAEEAGMELIVHRNPEAEALGINPFDHGSRHTDMWKTEGLKQALTAGGFDAAFGGARRDEEKSRAKERVFSFRSAAHGWTPRRSGPSCGTSTTVVSTRGRASASSRCPTGPSSISGNISCRKASRSCALFRRTPPDGGARRDAADGR